MEINKEYFNFQTYLHDKHNLPLAPYWKIIAFLFFVFFFVRSIIKDNDDDKHIMERANNKFIIFLYHKNQLRD